MTDLFSEDRLIVANCSAFFGDRMSAAKEMVQGGPIHVLTGDYLAELTMAILFRKQIKDPTAGYATTFLRQMEEIMGACLDRKIRVVVNAGGLNPRALAQKLEKVAEDLGLNPTIAFIEGDDLLPRLQELQNQGEAFIHMDKQIALKEVNAKPITANAYLGGWGIAEALRRGADIVVGGRIADASLTVGPAIWRFGWKQTDWDRLAGAVVAGHIIECGPQATGGNYAFFEEVPSFKNVGFPVAEICPDGSCIITKHPQTGGIVSVGTVTAQLLYEIRGPRYHTPDVIARFDSIEISQAGPDRVRISRVCGEPPTDTAKVCLNVVNGYRNSMTLILTGLDIEQKAMVVEKNLFQSLGGREQFAAVDVQLVRSEKEDPPTNEDAWAHLRISVMDPDPNKVGRLFSSKIVELVVANIPGLNLTTPPTNGSPAIMHWPALVSGKQIRQHVYMDQQQFTIDPMPSYCDPVEFIPYKKDLPPLAVSKTVSMPLGRVFGTRSGDKGGNANLGVWAKSDNAFVFLGEFLTAKKLKALLPDLSKFEIERYELPNLLAVNFFIKGILGDGVASSFRSDPQAKTLGEYLRAKVIDLPDSIIN